MISSSFKFLLTTLFVLMTFFAKAQTDTTLTNTPDSVEVIDVERGTVTGDVENVPVPVDSAYIHSPKKATIMSAALPGLGQIYNKKYWKVPIIYGGFAAAGYYLNDNLKNIEKYKDLYIAETDGDPNTINNTNFTTTDLTRIIDQYKQWRDLSYIAFAVIYALNIIDANVDAHLFYFDVSEDISLNIMPYMSPVRSQGVGFSLSLKL
ncbi:hypothetical protein G3O08_18480 [Cryomorpha ignava]|uniref:DUF5683 domain-containing protein n=1 Tax=Cryomorpha ignava TaxID=101383 RepID=A0A7K3WX94_9FLAO|nr:DUF5683 domain-containing protein [Cryomorpha ignava]NEN25482.1 hypothetical protein [Cryomorpha ignava]